MRYEEFIEDVAKIQVDGPVPEIMFPYGVKKMQFNGRTVLTPMTAEDYIEGLVSIGVDRREAETRPAYCTYSPYSGCHTLGSCTYCEAVYAGGWTCNCTQGLTVTKIGA